SSRPADTGAHAVPPRTLTPPGRERAARAHATQALESREVRVRRTRSRPGSTSDKFKNQTSVEVGLAPAESPGASAVGTWGGGVEGARRAPGCSPAVAVTRARAAWSSRPLPPRPGRARLGAETRAMRRKAELAGSRPAAS